MGIFGVQLLKANIQSICSFRSLYSSSWIMVAGLASLKSLALSRLLQVYPVIRLGRGCMNARSACNKISMLFLAGSAAWLQKVSISKGRRVSGLL